MRLTRINHFADYFFLYHYLSPQCACVDKFVDIERVRQTYRLREIERERLHGSFLTKNFQVTQAVSKVAWGQLPWPPPRISATTNHAWCMVNACRGRTAMSATVTPGTPATTARSTMVDLAIEYRGFTANVGRADSYLRCARVRAGKRKYYVTVRCIAPWRENIYRPVEKRSGSFCDVKCEV